MLMFINVFGGAAIAYFFIEPTTYKLAVVTGLGWTSIAAVARGTIKLGHTEAEEAQEARFREITPR
jgi:predicted methyltransferase